MPDLDLAAVRARADAATAAFESHVHGWSHRAARTALDSSADVPALLDEVEELRRAFARTVHKLSDQVDELRAQRQVVLNLCDQAIEFPKTTNAKLLATMVHTALNADETNHYPEPTPDRVHALVLTVGWFAVERVARKVRR